MRKLLLLTLACMGIRGFAQNLVQSNFTCNIVPQVMSSGTSTRLPLIVRATLSGLAANTVYRYYTNLAARTDFGGSNSGAGNPLFARSSSYLYSSGASLSSAGNYDSLTTDASGNYTGWFAIVNTGNVRFTAGSYVFPSIVLDSAGTRRGVTNSRFAATDSILVLGFASTAGATNGSGIRGSSMAADKNFVLLYDNTAGTGKPVSITPVENIGTTVASVPGYYSTSVAGVSGAWGTIIPNTLPNGIRRIEQRSLATGSIVNFVTSATGTWGSTNTVNPGAGTSALAIAATDAPLPVQLISFNLQQNGNTNRLVWITASELNNKSFVIERSADGNRFENIGTVKGAGNSSKSIQYSFTDAAPLSGSNYYRLAQVDFDGTITYSKVLSAVQASLTKNGIGLTTPNPFNTELFVNVTAKAGAAGIEVIDLAGSLHYKGVQQLQEGSNTIHIDTEAFPNGIYFVRITQNGDTYTKKIVKR